MRDKLVSGKKFLSGHDDDEELPIYTTFNSVLLPWGHNAVLVLRGTVFLNNIQTPLKDMKCAV